MNISLDKFYTGCYAIYAKGLDRFILIDHYDLQATFQTAELLSSKIPLIVYSISNGTIPKDRCLFYGIKDKTTEKIGGSSTLVSGQTPVFRLLDINNVTDFGVQEDFKFNQDSLSKLINYANFVHQYSHALFLTEKIFNNNSFILKNIIKKETIEDLQTSTEQMIEADRIFLEIRNTLYISNSIDEASSKIENIWLDNSTDRAWMKDRFYRIMKMPTPKSFNDVSGLLSEYLV